MFIAFKRTDGTKAECFFVSQARNGGLRKIADFGRIVRNCAKCHFQIILVFDTPINVRLV